MRSNAELIGANTVKGPSSSRSSARSDNSIALANIESSGTDCKKDKTLSKPVLLRELRLPPNNCILKIFWKKVDIMQFFIPADRSSSSKDCLPNGSDIDKRGSSKEVCRSNGLRSSSKERSADFAVSSVSSRRKVSSEISDSNLCLCEEQDVTSKT